MRVVGRDGHEIVIRRRWLPWKRRISAKKAGDYAPDADPLDALDLIGAEGLGLLIGLILLLPLLIVLVLVLSELFLLLLLLPLIVFARTLFGVPWTIEVSRVVSTTKRKLILSEDVKGWRASGERMHELAAGYSRTPPPVAGLPS